MSKATLTFEQSVQFAREAMIEGGKHAAKMLGEEPPHIREETTPSGGIRLVTVWPDGEETNEAIIERTADIARSN